MQDPETTEPRFNAAFNTCYADPQDTIVSGGYQASYEIEEEGTPVTLELDAIKTFDVGFGSETYGHGIGRLATVGDPNQETELVFVRIGDTERGTRLDSLYTITVSSQEEPRFSGRPLTITSYPNPFRSRT
jgi:hypothetical protein